MAIDREALEALLSAEADEVQVFVKMIEEDGWSVSKFDIGGAWWMCIAACRQHEIQLDLPSVAPDYVEELRSQLEDYDCWKGHDG